MAESFHESTGLRNELALLLAQLRQDIFTEMREHRGELRITTEEIRKADRMSIQQEGRLQSVEMIMRKHDQALYEGNGGTPSIRQELAMFRAWHATLVKIGVMVLGAAALAAFWGMVNYRQEITRATQEREQLQHRLELLEKPHAPAGPL